MVDTTGENPVSAMIADVSKDAEGNVVITCIDDARHGLEDGDHVTFSEILGTKELNGCNPLKVKVLGPYSFSVGDVPNLSKYERGGIATQVKMPKTLTFKPLSESIRSPEFVMTDFAKFERPPQIHVAFQALHKFVEKNGKVPRPWNKDDATEFVSIAKATAVDGGNDTELESALLEKFSKLAAGNVSPINATIGGVVAQEVMKACSGKFHPIYQWLYFDALECLEAESVPEESATPTGSRYDGQVAVFGRDFQEKLGELDLFSSYKILVSREITV